MCEKSTSSLSDIECLNQLKNGWDELMYRCLDFHMVLCFDKRLGRVDSKWFVAKKTFNPE